RAIADYDTAIRLRPNYADAYKNRGYAYVERGEIAKALADYRTAAQFAPESSFTRTESLAAAAEQEKKLDAAVLTAQKESSALRDHAIAPQVATDLGRRVALIIGNGAYQNVAQLTNPANDAKLIADALQQDGFNV